MPGLYKQPKTKDAEGNVGVGAAKKGVNPFAKSKKAAPKSKEPMKGKPVAKVAPKKSATKAAPKTPPMNPNATGMAQIPYGQQVVPRPAGMSSLGIGSDVSKSGHVRQPNPMLAARRPNRPKGAGMMKLGTGSDAAEDAKMSRKELSADIRQDKATLKQKK